MLAQKHAQPWAFMTAYVKFSKRKLFIDQRRYGRLDGLHCSESPALLQGILRRDWNFDGVIISDWYDQVFFIFAST